MTVPTAETVRKNYAELSESQKTRVLNGISFRAIRHSILMMCFTIFGAGATGVTLATMANEKVAPGLGLDTPEKTLAFQLAALPVIGLSVLRGSKHWTQNMHLENGKASLALSDGRTVTINGVPIEMDEPETLLDEVNQPARKEIFAIIRQVKTRG
jgi:hypothetical protein